MKLLVVGLNYAPEPTGIGPYSASLSRRLADGGDDVRVITCFPHYPSWHFGTATRLRVDETDGRVLVRRLRHLLPRTSIGFSRLVSEISFGLRAAATAWGRPDQILLVSPALFASTIVLLVARVRRPRIPVTVWVQDLYSVGIAELTGGLAASLAARVLWSVERWTMRTADRVVVIHESLVETIRRMEVGPQSIEVVRNWCHLSMDVPDDRAAGRARMGWRDDETVVLHAGNMGRKQHLANVVEAARIADGMSHSFRFVLLGDGSERADLEHRARGVRSVDFLDPLPDDEYTQALRSADVLLVNEAPGVRAMALPSKLISYFAAGLPVVAATSADSLSASEVRAADAGVVVDPHVPMALLDAVDLLRDDPARAQRLGANGLAYCTDELTEDRAVDRFIHLFESFPTPLDRGHRPIRARRPTVARPDEATLPPRRLRS